MKFPPFALLLLLPLTLNAQQTAATPPMGWNSWNHFATKVTDADIRAATEALVTSGMRDAGYIYVNIDDAWEGKRGVDGVIYPNDKFPNMKALADYVHAKGLKLGIYSSPGPKTCAGYEGSYGHEEQDAQTYADWGIDYLKYDSCSFRDIIKTTAGDDVVKAQVIQRTAYEKMHRAILKTGRPIVFSYCQYGRYAVWNWAAQGGANLWRTTTDIKDNWDRMSNIGFSQAGLESFSGPGHWNDPDMLEVGNGGMTRNEYQLHFSLWAMLSAPLLAGNDLSKMSEETKAILMNRDIIAIDQDSLGRQGKPIWIQGPLEIWAKDLANGKHALAFFNRGESEMTFSSLPKELSGIQKTSFVELWTKDKVHFNASPDVHVAAHGVKVFVEQ
jgi:alpha-galactosidase